MPSSARWHTGWLRETLLRGVWADWTIIDFSEWTRLRLLFYRSSWLSNLALGMILFVLVVCLALALLKRTRWAGSGWIHSSLSHWDLFSFNFHLLHNLCVITVSSSAALKSWRSGIYILCIYSVFWDLFFSHHNMAVCLLVNISKIYSMTARGLFYTTQWHWLVFCSIHVC